MTHPLPLEDILRQIEAYCTEHDIAIFQGSIESGDESVNTCNWDTKSQQDWKRFLDTMVKRGADIVYFETTTLEDVEEEKQKLLKAAAFFEEGVNDRISELENLLEPHFGKVMWFTLCVLLEGNYYKYQDWAEWSDAYLEIDEYAEDAEYKRSESIDKAAALAKEKALAESIARNIIASPDYLSAKNQHERFEVASFMARESGHFLLTGQIVGTCNLLYREEVHPIVLADRKEQLISLFKENPSLTKVEGKARLSGISRNEFERVWVEAKSEMVSGS